MADLSTTTELAQAAAVGRKAATKQAPAPAAAKVPRDHHGKVRRQQSAGPSYRGPALFVPRRWVELGGTNHLGFRPMDPYNMPGPVTWTRRLGVSSSAGRSRRKGPDRAGSALA